MTTRNATRLLVAVVGLMAVLSLATPAEPAESRRAFFEYGTDRTSWYWTKQQTHTVEAGPIAQIVRAPSPVRSDTLPVAAENGKPEKEAAIYFNLFDRGVVAGSEVTRVVMTLAESSPKDGAVPNEQPSFNASGKAIQACRLDKFWAAGEAEEWDKRPQASDACVKGTRDGEADPPTWTFDLTSLASTWGEAPFSNNGVMLTPVIAAGGATESWQVNLKIPSRDDPLTPPNEYDETKELASVQISFEGPEGGDEVLGAGFGGSGRSGEAGELGEPAAGAAPAEAAGDEQAQPEQAVAASAGDGITVPGIVWTLIPAGLLALAAVRSVVMDTARGPRPGGVIAAIRRFNEQRRGTGAAEGASR